MGWFKLAKVTNVNYDVDNATYFLESKLDYTAGEDSSIVSTKSNCTAQVYLYFIYVDGNTT